MRRTILLLGLAKTGTSLLAYKLHHALPEPRALVFEPTTFGQNSGPLVKFHREALDGAGADSNVVVKCLLFPQFPIDWDEVWRCAALYDERVMLVRDPRDRLISVFFYSWYRGHMPDDEPDRSDFVRLYHRALQRVRAKESAPRSVPFTSLFLEHELDWERDLYASLTPVVRDLGSDWHRQRYAEMVRGELDGLSRGLGLDLSDEVEVAAEHRRVVRTRSYENWRSWFTPEDCEVLRPIYDPYLELIGYDPDDWALDIPSSLPAESGSAYMERMFAAV